MEEELKGLLEARDVGHARNLLLKEENSSLVEDKAWELVPLISSYVTAENEEDCPVLVAACTNLLQILAERGNPKELIIGFLENCEAFSESIRFRTTLPALSKALLRLPLPSRKVSWSWTFDTIIGHLRAYEPLESLGLTGQDRLLYENDPQVHIRVQTLESVVDSFLSPILMTLSEMDKGISHEVAFFILHCFHKPMIYLNLHKEDQGSVEPHSRALAESLLTFLLQIIPNPIDLITFDRRHRISMNLKKNLKEDEGSLQDDNKVSDLSVGTIFYLIFGEGLCTTSLPQVYHPNYLYQIMCSYVTKLQRQKQEMVVFKGLILFKNIVKIVPRLSLLDSDLEFDAHTAFLTSLMDVIIHHDLKEYRSLAYKNFTQHYERLSIDGRYSFFNNVLHISNHSGLIGDVIAKWKNTVLWNMDNENKYEEYKGPRLKSIIRKFCKLAHAEETDLLEVSEEIFSSLNALYVLLMRDKNNITDIWDMKDELAENYIHHISIGLPIAKAHYQLKLHEEANSEKPEVTLMVGGQPLPKMSKSEMNSVIRSAISTLEMMDSLLIRLKKVLSMQ